MPAEEQVAEETVAAPENAIPAEETPAGEETVDIVALISEGEEEVKPVLDKKDKALIRFKQQGKETKRENEQLKTRLDELEKKLADKDLSKPDPDKYESGIDDEQYATDLTEFITKKAAISVEDVVAKRLKEERASQKQEEYIERHESVIRDKQETANSLILAHTKDMPEVAAIIKSVEFMDTLAAMPISLTRKIVENPDVGILFEYYAKNPQRFANLAAQDPDEVVNLGIKMGQIKSLKSGKKQVGVIKPLQGGDNTVKRHPIKDSSKYVLPDGTKDYAKWNKDMFPNG